LGQPGSYLLANNLSYTSGNCLVITASLVTIDFQGFSIIGQVSSGSPAIIASANVDGITVRNGSISGVGNGVELPGSNSIVEGLRVVGNGLFSFAGIQASGIVKSNIVSNFKQIGIGAGGIVIDNYASGVTAIAVSAGSAVIGNTAAGNLNVFCPSNVTNNTVTGGSLLLNGTGCKNTNNVVAP
jgi:hypothetical protein